MFVRGLVSQMMGERADIPRTSDSGAIESQLEEIPFHSCVFEHVFKPISLNSMQ